MKLIKIIQKYYEYILTKLKVLTDQRIFRYDDINIKYMYKPRTESDILVIVFSACTRPGLSARYNYVKTLEGIPINRLFILDDFGEDGRGSYYLGNMPDFKEQKGTLALINKVIAETNPTKLLFCGSCKGGYAALNFGSRYKDSIMIVGEPTYRIATEFRLDEGLIRYWVGEATKEKIDYMDNYLTNMLKSNCFIESQKLFLFFSDRDEYYERHTKPLVQDLKKFGYKIQIETGQFEQHADLGLFFPAFLKNKIDACLH